MTRVRVAWPAVAFLFLATNAFTCHQDTLRLSLQQAVDIGLKKNADVHVADLQRHVSEYAVHEATGNFLPKLMLNGSYNRNIDKPVIFLPETFGKGGATRIGLNNNFITSLDLSLMLYSRYNTANRQYAQRNFILQKEVLSGAQQTVITNIRKTYTSCLVSYAVVSVRRKSVDNAALNLNIVREKLRRGTATEFDVASAEVKMATSKNNLLESESQLTPVENNLKVLIGVPVTSYVVPVDSLLLTEGDLEIPWSRDMLADNNALHQKQTRIEIARFQKRMSQAAYFPSLSGTGTYQYQSQQNDFDFSNYRWVLTSSVGVKLQVPLFNGTITRSRVQQAVMSENIAKVQRDYTSLSNEAQYDQLVSSMYYLKQRIIIQTDNIKLSERALKMVKERYNYGKATFLEVSNAEVDYETARLSYLQTVGDYKNALYDLELLTGQIF